MNLLHRPVVHFIALGALLYFVKGLAFPAVPAEPVVDAIVIDAARVDELQQDWLDRTGSLPNEATLAGLIRTEVDDRLLIAEARRRGLHRSDPVVQRRLLQNLSFLGADEGSPARARLDEAYRLGMDRTDLVVRRRLVQLLQLEAYGRARKPSPDDAELEAYLREHRDRFTRPARLRLQHVYFSRDARGDATAGDARAALTRFTEAATAPGPMGDEGDPFMFPRDLPSRSERELARTFGSEFASRVFELPEGAWQGPVRSAYGEHLVFVHERTPAALPPLDVVRSEVRESLLAERGKRAMADLLDELREAYPVQVEGRPAFAEGGE